MANQRPGSVSDLEIYTFLSSVSLRAIYFFLLKWCAFIKENTISLLGVAVEENLKY